MQLNRNAIAWSVSPSRIWASNTFSRRIRWLCIGTFCRFVSSSLLSSNCRYSMFLILSWQVRQRIHKIRKYSNKRKQMCLNVQSYAREPHNYLCLFITEFYLLDSKLMFICCWLKLMMCLISRHTFVDNHQKLVWTNTKNRNGEYYHISIQMILLALLFSSKQ